MLKERLVQLSGALPPSAIKTFGVYVDEMSSAMVLVPIGWYL
jgi:hypothetical protein